MGRIKRTRKAHKGNIPERTKVNDFGLKFSFKYLDTSNEKFPMIPADDSHINDLFTRLKHVCDIDIGKFHSSHTLHSHPIDWNDKNLTEKSFPFKNDQLNDKAWQFAINSKTRIHGALVNDVFFVVWFDPDHLLDPSKK